MDEPSSATKWMLIRRIFYGTLAITVLLTLVLLDVYVARMAEEDISGPLGDLLMRGSVLPLAIVAALVLGAAELTRLFSAAGVRPHRRFALLMVCIVAASPWFASAGWLGRGAAHVWELHWPVLLVLVTIGGAGIAVILRGSPQGSIRDFSATVGIVLYVGFLGSFALQIRCVGDVPHQHGAWLLLATVLIIKSSDIGAFFAGFFFGRHRLAPQISPNKTVEGAIGGLAASTGVSVLFTWIGMSIDWSVTPGSDLEVAGLSEKLWVVLEEVTRSLSATPDADGLSPLVRAAILGLLLSFAGQVGDLLESCFKRDAGAKDSGRLMPLFGGILDLIDSPIFALPVAWFMMAVVWDIV